MAHRCRRPTPSWHPSPSTSYRGRAGPGRASRSPSQEEDCRAPFSAGAASGRGVPADLLTVTLDQQRAFIYFMLRTARGSVDPQSTRTVMQPLVTMSFPGLPARVQPLARAILHGYGRLFFGDDLFDRTGIPHSIAKNLLPPPHP